jgi:hypothetical protein
MPDEVTTVAVEDRTVSLLRNRDFVSLWAGQSVSMTGSAVSFIGLPLVAVLVLHVSAFGLSVIAAVNLLPPVVCGPFIGPVADRHSRHRLMLIADLGRAAVLAAVPVAYLAGLLTLWLMVLAGFLTGVLTSLFNVSLQAFLPGIVPVAQLGDGNAKLSASGSASGVLGPGLASGLIALGGSPIAGAPDSFSYLISACALLRIRDDGRGKQRTGPKEFWQNIGAGFRLLGQDPILRTVTRSRAIMACFSQLQTAIYFLFLTADLHFGATTISLVFVAAAAIGLLAAIGCNRLAARLGLGKLIIAGEFFLALGAAFLALAHGSRLEAAAFIIASEACAEVALIFVGVGRATLFQLRAADEVRGAIMGAARFISAASTPFAALLAGLLGTVLGLRATLIIGAAGMTLGLVAVLRPQVWRLQQGQD